MRRINILCRSAIPQWKTSSETLPAPFWGRVSCVYGGSEVKIKAESLKNFAACSYPLDTSRKSSVFCLARTSCCGLNTGEWIPMSRYFKLLLLSFACLLYFACEGADLRPLPVVETDGACCPTPESVLARRIQHDADAQTVLDSTGATAALIQEGHVLYRQHGCALCHGMEGRGDGPVAVTLKPQPGDFRNPAVYQNGRTIRSIAKTINWGVAGASSAMPAFPHIDGDERVKIAYYINALQDSDK